MICIGMAEITRNEIHYYFSNTQSFVQPMFISVGLHDLMRQSDHLIPSPHFQLPIYIEEQCGMLENPPKW